MVYDEARGETLLFGGFGPDGEPKGDTWIWNGETWRLASVEGPPPRKWPAAAYDAKRQVVVLHGGREGAGRSGRSLDDTWIWDGRGWREINSPGPTPRDHHRAAYDRKRDRVVLFGGWNGADLENDTWEWSGSGWQQVANSGPSPRAPFGMVYHAALQAVVIAGGQDLGTAHADVWSWSGSDWKKLDTEVPGARGFHAMSFAPERDTAIVFGGRNGDELFNDLWLWSGDEWMLASNDGPLRRGIYASAFDAKRGELVIHGSGDRVAGKWELESQTWTWSRDTGWRLVVIQD